jgi:hypothetical protein
MSLTGHTHICYLGNIKLSVLFNVASFFSVPRSFIRNSILARYIYKKAIS